MSEKTRGIVLSKIKYSENSIICKVYTEEFGAQSYLVRIKRKTRGSASYYQPLSLLDLVVTNKKNRGLQRIKEVRFSHQYQSIPFHILKSSTCLFLADVLKSCLKEEEKNNVLFTFIRSSLINLDNNVFDSNMHLRFLLDLSVFLGFPPNNENSNLPFFDLLNGCFIKKRPSHKHFISGETIVFFSALLKRKENVKVKNKRELINALLEYYELHLDGFFVKSHNVLEDVFQK